MAAEVLRAGETRPFRVGRYEAFLQIGAGGMARVFLAVQRGAPGQKPELVAVKILKHDVVEDQHVLALFTDEARIAMRLDHPNVVRTREVIATPPDYALAMDFHNGRSLLDVVSRLGRTAVPLDEHVYVLAKVLAGLAYAHELRDDRGQPFGIVHRDVSPANVLVTYGGEVKLLDFGIAKATGALAVTQDGVVRGKLGYAAPEQCLGKPADPRSDVYAVGVMLWEAIAGRRRASGETWQSVLQARVDDTEPALEDVRPDAPKALAAIVRRALARNPDDRYEKASEFQAELEQYLAARRGPPIGPPRIAGILKPHFDQDRSDLERSVERFLKGGKVGPAARMPLPAGRVSAAPMSSRDTLRPVAPGGLEENTAPIPVDSALLMMTRGESEPPISGSPTVPPPTPATTTAPPPPDARSQHVTIPNIDPESFSPESVAALAAVEASPVEIAPPPAEPLERIVVTPKAAPVAVDALGLVAVSKASATPAWAAAAVPASTKKTPVWPFLVLGAGAIGLAAVVLAPRLTAPKVAPAAPVAAEESRTTASKTNAPKVDLVKVRISVDPPDAVVTLDGRPLEGRPYVATLPRDNVDHPLTAVADGCKDQQQMVHLNSDLALLVALKCQRQGLRLSGKPLAHKPGAPASAPAAAAAPAAAPAAPAAPAPVPVSDENPYK